MARLVGVDLPRDKKVEIGLTYIFVDRRWLGKGMTMTRKQRQAREAQLVASGTPKDADPLTRREAKPWFTWMTLGLLVSIITAAWAVFMVYLLISGWVDVLMLWTVGTTIAAVIALLVCSGNQRVPTETAFTMFENNTGWSNSKSRRREWGCAVDNA